MGVTVLLFELRPLIDRIQRKLIRVCFHSNVPCISVSSAKSKEKVLFYPYSSLFLEYKLKIQSIGVSNRLCCISFLTVSSHLNCMFSFFAIYWKHGDAALQSALKPLYTLLPSLWNVTNTELVDPVNTPINEIVERRKLKAKTYEKGEFVITSWIW